MTCGILVISMIWASILLIDLNLVDPTLARSSVQNSIKPYTWLLLAELFINRTLFELTFGFAA